MKLTTLSLATATVLGLLAGTRADAAISLGLSSVQDATIQFTGTGSQSTVTFANGPSGSSFAITTVDGSPGGSPAGLVGTISGAFTYLVAGITTAGPLQTALLSGTGILTIGPSGGGPALTANITGIDILSAGAIGGINGLTGGINLSNFAYTGSNVALLQLEKEGTASGGIATFSYQFGSPKSLEALATAGTLTATTYSGTITTPVAVPEPGTMGMALTGATLMGLGCYRQRRRMLA